MKKYIIKVNGKVYEVEMEEVIGETATTTIENERQVQSENIKEVTQAAPKKQTATEGEPIDAPMPGTILNIAVKVGDKVSKNQLILVLEAMKMENEIVSPRDGIITAINVTKGQIVNPGENLVKIG
jgi:biotin carboxyl carrier protein